MASPGLLRVEAKLGIGFFRKIGFAADYEGKRKGRQQDGRYSVQVTIMFCSAAFEKPMPVALKRAYDKPSLSDGQRVLVDRLWPRGISKDKARIDQWLKNLAPSDTLRKWFHVNGNWDVFKKRYFKELSTPEASADLEILYRLLSEHSKVTLIYSSKNTEQNNAVALKELLEGMKKPPSSSGPAKAAAASGRVAKRRPVS